MQEDVTERCTLALEQNAKGSWQGKVVVDSNNVARSKELLSEGVKALKEVAAEKGLALAGAYY